MTVKIRIPSSKGHETLILSHEDAKQKLSDFAQASWLVSINGKSVDSRTAQSQVQDGDQINVAKVVGGG
jgi:sulfur carrier protein ThiS